MTTTFHVHARYRLFPVLLLVLGSVLMTPDRPASQEAAPPSRARRSGALIMAVFLFIATPLMAVASAAAEPRTPGEWMSSLFGTWSREVDPTQKGLSAVVPHIPPQQLQSTSEPAPPKAPPSRAEPPRLWLPKPSLRRKPTRRFRVR
jgi:hypothetical protein